MEIKQINIKIIETNNGQIEGLPKNPRFIRDERFEALKRSIQDAPDMLQLRELIVFPFAGKYVVIAGNMRLRACKDLNYKEVPCKVLSEDTTAEKLREYTIKDNVPFGQDDMDTLFNEWDVDELKDFGFELPKEIAVSADNEVNDITITPCLRIEVNCKDEKTQEHLYNELIERGFECRVLTL